MQSRRFASDQVLKCALALHAEWVVKPALCTKKSFKCSGNINIVSVADARLVKTFFLFCALRLISICKSMKWGKWKSVQPCPAVIFSQALLVRTQLSGRCSRAFLWWLPAGNYFYLILRLTPAFCIHFIGSARSRVVSICRIACIAKT